MKPLGQSFLYEIPAEGARTLESGIVTVAWRTEVPGLILTSALGPTFFRVTIAHEASGVGLLRQNVAVSLFERVLEFATEIGKLGLDWTSPDIIALYEELVRLPDLQLERAFRITQLDVVSKLSVPEMRAAMSTVVELLKERRAKLQTAGATDSFLN